MKINNILTGIIAMALVIGGSIPAYAQKGKAKDSRSTELTVSIKIVNEAGKPVNDAVLLSSFGTKNWFADDNGKISARVWTYDVNSIVAEGYDEETFVCTQNNIPEEIVLHKKQITGENGGSPAAISSISGETLEKFPELVLGNTLQGKIAGLTVQLNADGLGNNDPTIYLRGLHSGTSNSPIFLIDGLERSIDDLVPEEIDKITVYKDSLGKILYGARAANGVVEITTKRGIANRARTRISAESGINITTRVPEYLDSYNYALLYNEARANDGMPAFYSDEQLQGYKNSTGVNDLFYPNVDYYDYFTRNVSNYRKATLDMIGGNEKLKYSLVMNYLGQDGFEKVGTLPQLNRFNIRGTVDANVTDFLSIYANASARLEMRKWGNLTMASVYSNLSSLRPNEYPLMVASDVIGLTPMEDGTPYMLTNMIKKDNLLAHMEYGGFNQERYVISQTNIGLNFDLNRFVKGLKANAEIMFDNYARIAYGQTDTYPVYAIRGTNTEDLEFIQLTKLSLQSNQSKSDDNFYQNLGYKGEVTYERTAGKNWFKAGLSYNYTNYYNTGASQDFINDNTALRLNYGYNEKLYVEGILSLMGSIRYASGRRMFGSSALGVSWFVTPEFKLKASGGILGYDKNTTYVSHITSWSNGSTATFGEKNVTSFHQTVYNRVGHDIKWEKDYEWNVGAEALLFSKRLKAEVNAFKEYRRDVVLSLSSKMSSVIGDFLGYDNYGAVNNGGVEMDLSWSDKCGDFRYTIGGNAIYSKNILLDWNYVEYPDENRNPIGQPSDAIFGYKALGLFGRDVDINRSVKQYFGQTQVGDIAYEDITGDGIVNSNDQTVIGNSYPRVSLGLNINLQFKNWNLYADGAAQLGFNALKNNSYYWMNAEDKYSVVALDRYNPETNPDGWYPRLTTTTGTNNFIKSTYWLESASFFRLKNVELSYTFNLRSHSIKGIKIFARGTNLFVLAEEKNLDPEIMNAGISNYPLYRTVTGGATLTF